MNAHRLACFYFLTSIASAAAFGPAHHHQTTTSNRDTTASFPTALKRRDILASSSTIVAPLILFHTSLRPAGASVQSLNFSSVNEIVQYIQLHCNKRFLHSVRSSNYNFLYRGEQVTTSSTDSSVLSAFIINDPCDLLDPNTYQSSEAALYFAQLEKQLSARQSDGYSVKPSNGHLATTCPKEAAKWGKPMSIWPIGESVDFMWLRNGGVFWPNQYNIDQQPKEGIDKIIASERLDKALQGDGWEIMFRADDGFVAVDARLDEELRRLFKRAL